jgi:hypothetical protein
MSNAEKRDFRISNNMIFHLVFSQAGTIAKALGELVMNSQDAGADTFRLEISPEGFVASDNGHGFRSRKEIEDWFEELGFDHGDDLHQEDGRFSRFGLGRAQCMAFASTDWLTNSFCMSVDIKARGISYELKTDQAHIDGCTVKGRWYEVLSFSDLKDTLREFEELIAFTKIAVEVNGKVVNRKNVKWDFETDAVMVKRRETGGLQVYNQGVLVKTYAAYQYGSGLVVSKVPFTLNIARNDILHSTCAVWKEVRALLRSDAVNQAKSKPRLTEDQRQLLLSQAVAGELVYGDIEKSALIEDVTGRKWKLDKLIGTTITVHTEGSRAQADRIQQSKQAFVLSAAMMDAVGAETPEALIKTLERIVNSGPRQPWWQPLGLKYVPIAQLLAGNNERYTLLSNKELTKTERVALGAMKRGLSEFERAVYLTINGKHRPARTLYIGESDHAKAWTDGSTYIAVSRTFLAEHVRDGFRGFTAIANVLIHELCHDSNTATGHDHGAEFYEAFHDVICGRFSYCHGSGIRIATAHFLGRAQKEGLKLNRSELRDLDREVELERDIFGETAFLDEVQAVAAAG